MDIQLKKIIEQAKNIWEKTTKKTKIIVAAILVFIMIFSLVATLILSNKSYVTLYTGLSSDETIEISTKLQTMGVDYQLSGSDTILVLPDQELKVKAQLSTEGYPKSGFTYNEFKDNIDFMTTDFEKNSYRLFDLQNRIASTIRLLDGVKDAKVTIALGDDKKYVLQEDMKETTASVVVIMQNGGSPTASQVKGIQNLVSKSITGAKIENIVIVDGNGEEVLSKEENLQATATDLKLDIQKNIEQTVKSKILHLLNPITGEDHVRVSVKSTVDIDKKIKELITYTPVVGESGIPSKEVTSQESVLNGGQEGGVPGTDSNADIPVYPGVTVDGDKIYFKDEKSYEYLVNQVKEQVESDGASVSDLTVSVAIDGDDLNEDTIINLKSVVGTAAGIELEKREEKISIINMPFAKKQNDFLSTGIDPLILFVMIAIIVLALIFTIIIINIKKKRAKAALLDNSELEETDIYNGVEPIDLNRLKRTREMDLKEQIGEFTTENPEISAKLIKSWLSGGDNND